MDMTQDTIKKDEKRHNVEMVLVNSQVTIHCVACNATWEPGLDGLALAHNWWQCPNKCNDPAKKKVTTEGDQTAN